MSFSLPGNEHLFATTLSLARHAAWASTADGSLVGGGHAKRLRSLGSRVSWPQDWCVFMGIVVSLAILYPLSYVQFILYHYLRGGILASHLGGIFVLDKQITPLRSAGLPPLPPLPPPPPVAGTASPKGARGASKMELWVWLQEGVESRKMELLPSGSLHRRFQITKCRL